VGKFCGLGRRHGFFTAPIFAVVLVILIAGWRMKISILKFLDVRRFSPSSGNFSAAIGNIINGDVIGYPTKLLGDSFYTNPNSFAPSHTVAYQPAAVYER